MRKVAFGLPNMNVRQDIINPEDITKIEWTHNNNHKLAYRLDGEKEENMNLYMIEYYDPEVDIRDYEAVRANSEIDAIKYFIRSTHGTKIVVECNRLGGVK